MAQKFNSLLVETTITNIRFNETDPLGIVWHGNYAIYFEDGRAAFGTKYGIHYLDFYKNGYVAPIVNLNCDFKKMVKYGDKIMIETTFENHKAAKIVFRYKIYNLANMDLVATGSTTQVFLDIDKQEMQFLAPPFLIDWKKKYNLS